jgi:hypothetical protein
MGIRFGPFDPLQLTFEIMNTLMQKGLISYDEARQIIRKSLPPEMPDAEKEALLNSMVKRVNNSPSRSPSPSQVPTETGDSSNV